MESAAGSRRGCCITLRIITGTATSPLVAHVAQTACADLRSSRSHSLTSPALSVPLHRAGAAVKSDLSSVPSVIQRHMKKKFFYTFPKTVEEISCIPAIWMGSCWFLKILKPIMGTKRDCFFYCSSKQAFHINMGFEQEDRVNPGNKNLIDSDFLRNTPKSLFKPRKQIIFKHVRPQTNLDTLNRK